MMKYNAILLKMSQKSFNFVYIKVYILLYTVTILIFPYPYFIKLNINRHLNICFFKINQLTLYQ
jgi:hypothetical protein